MASLNFKPLDIPTGSTFDFADSFEGTNIPKPPPSPPPAPKVFEGSKSNGALSSHPTTPTKDESGADASMLPPPAKKQQVSPSSPTDSQDKRPSSVRKLLSLRSLKEKDRNSQAAGVASPLNGKKSASDWDDAARPGSPYGAPSIMSDASRPSIARKRSSGWFGSRRKSGLFGSVADENTVPNGGAVQPVKPKGPPPPTIPEFKEFGSLNGALSGGSLGADDLFKNIKG